VTWYVHLITSFAPNSGFIRSVVARVLHRSYWPTVLRSDAAASKGVQRKVKLIVWTIILTAALATIAAIVTPLGLYDAVAPNKSPTFIDFHYVKDTSAFGTGTPPRPSLGFSRICRNGLLACPNSGQNVTLVNSTDANGITELGTSAPYGYSTRIPSKYVDFWESGVSGSKFNRTVSSSFDIQWRTWSTSTANSTVALGLNSTSYFNNGSAFAIGSYRSLTNVLLDEACETVEGLIVDSKSGGIGFRNHTIPSQSLPYGAQWSEDILFIEPVTECVNLNVSLDFSLTKKDLGNDIQLTNARLVDQGGFVNFDKRGLPLIAIGNQTDPLLSQRAQTGAWVTNMLMMLIWNITDRNPNGSVTLNPPFTYLDSYMGKEIFLPTQGKDKVPAASFLTSYDSFLTSNDLSRFFETLTLIPTFLDSTSSTNSTSGAFNSGVSNGSISAFNYTGLPPNPYQFLADDITSYG
jgi:hypothetical protein